MTKAELLSSLQSALQGMREREGELNAEMNRLLENLDRLSEERRDLENQIIGQVAIINFLSRLSLGDLQAE